MVRIALLLYYFHSVCVVCEGATCTQSQHSVDRMELACCGQERKGRQMRNSEEIVTRLAEVESEIESITGTIQHLGVVVKDGRPDWMQALEALAAAYQRRNALRVQAENLRWVLAPITQLAS